VSAETSAHGVEALRAALAPFAFAARATAAVLRLPSLRGFTALLSKLLLSSCPVVAVVAFFSGAMLTVQAASSLALIGGGPLSGMIVGLGGVREMFPLLAVAAVAARTGAEFASELGTMRVTQQVDALSVMGADPMRLLVGPRVLAAALGTPVCVLLACATGLLGSWVVGVFQLGIDRGSMWAALTSAVTPMDFIVGLVKGLVLGWLVGIVTTREGLFASGGPRGVGAATNRAVVRAMIVVCAVSLVMTYLFYGRAIHG
jgi:phospholipid/cholesterol/gamma-HCH transport system permease protein